MFCHGGSCSQEVRSILLLQGCIVHLSLDEAMNHICVSIANQQSKVICVLYIYIYIYSKLFLHVSIFEIEFHFQQIPLECICLGSTRCLSLGCFGSYKAAGNASNIFNRASGLNSLLDSLSEEQPPTSKPTAKKPKPGAKGKGKGKAGKVGGNAGKVEAGSVGQVVAGNAGNGKAGKSKGNAGKAGQDNAGKAGKGNAGKGNAGKDKAKAGKAKAKAGNGKAGNGKAGKGEAGNGKAGKGEAGKGEAGKGEAGKGKLKMTYKNVHSRAYHSSFGRAIRAGIGPEGAKLRARQLAKAAVSAWRACEIEDAD